MKTVIKISFLFCALLCSIFHLQAQVPCDELPLPEEQVTLHLDRNICLAGETIWFKAWCFLDGQIEEDLSRVLYLEIFDETQKVIVQEKYLLTNNNTSGSFQIPEDVLSKHYFVRAYTRYMRNFSLSNFHYQQLTIINPLIEGTSVQTVATAPKDTKVKTSNQEYLSNDEKELELKLSKEKFKPREQISFDITSLETITAELSITVRMKGLGNQPNKKGVLQNEWLLASCLEDPFCRRGTTSDSHFTPSSNSQQQKTLSSPSQLEWRPETRGLTISGLIQNEKEESITGALAMVSILQKEPLLYLGSSDNQGAFTICLHNMQDQKNIFVGTPSEDNTVLIRNDFDSNIPEVTSIPLQFDSTLHNILESLNLNQQLKRIYPKNKVQTVYESDPPSITSTNIIAPDRRIVLADFIEMTTMSEVFDEITSGVLLRKKNKKETLSVFNSKEQKRYDNPLVLLDNIPVFNVSELLKIAPSKIEAIELYNTDYIMGDYTLGAIISIISKTDDFAGYKWGEQAAFTKFKTFDLTQPFAQVVHSEESHLPDFRPVLYWQPTLKFQQQKKNDIISIYAPDRPGIYEILVQGFTNFGESCFGYVTFEVAQR